MGHWAIHIEGHGIHDNDREDDADAMLRAFADRLALAGQEIHSATFTVGSIRELRAAGRAKATPLPCLSAPTEYLHR